MSKSYFLNYLYWQFPHRDCINYINFLKSSYSNQPILDAHLNDLLYFINYSKENDIVLYVVIFPYLIDISRCQPFLKPIVNFFTNHHVEIIVVSDLVANIPAKKLIINKMDLHPNELVNQLVGEELFKRISRKDHSQKYFP